MDSPGTILIVSTLEAEWEATSGILAEDYGYRILLGRAPAETAGALRDAHVDLVIADETGGAAVLSELRISRIPSHVA